MEKLWNYNHNQFSYFCDTGFLLFVVGMTINIHSDHILRSLRKPGETVYRIPQGKTGPDPDNNLTVPHQDLQDLNSFLSGGMFEFVSGANFFGEMVEWCGYAIAAWSLPTFAFAFFTVCSIGPRAYHHHRYLHQSDVPRVNCELSISI